MNAPLRKQASGRTRSRLALASALSAAWLVLGTSCMVVPTNASRGLLFSHVTRPLDVNPHDSRVSSYPARRGDLKRITVSYVDLMWGNSGVGDLAKQAGFQEVLYADLETLTIFTFWKQNWVHVYGR